LQAAKGEILVRVDGRTLLEPEYVERCVVALEETTAAMVGGPLEPKGVTWVERAIGSVLTSKFGAGPARYRRVGGAAQWADVVYLGAARVDVLRGLGGYDEGFSTNEDAEMAHRLQELGGIWFDPKIRSIYRPRSTFRGLAQQYYRYGRGRAGTVCKHPHSLHWRQLAAPLLVVGLLLPGRRRVAAAYATVVVAACAEEMRHDRAAGAGLAVAMPTMHLAWGIGFLFGIMRQMATRGSTAARGRP
jgi:hypothetical protein